MNVVLSVLAMGLQPVAGQASEQRSHLLSRAVPGSAGRRVGGSTPNSVLPAAPTLLVGSPAADPPAGLRSRPHEVGGRPSAQVCRTLPAGRQHRQGHMAGQFLLRPGHSSEDDSGPAPGAVSVAMRQGMFPHINTKGEKELTFY